MSLQNQFKQFLSDIEPSDTTTAYASKAHTNLREHLENHEIFSEYHLNTFLSGSYKRNTAIRPRIKNGIVSRPDVDIIVVTVNTREDDPCDILNFLYDALEDEYGKDKVKLNRRSVHVDHYLADMDAVPIIAPNGMDGTLYIPDRDLKEWLETNPPRHTSWTTEMNTVSGGRFKPLVKLMKWWRRHNPTIARKPKGFIIECITAECMELEETSYAELFVGTLEQIVSRYQYSIAIGQVPMIQDPGVSTNSVTRKLSFEAFEGFYNKAKAHAKLGREAINELDEEKALTKWRQIFGDRFPAPPSSTNKSLLAPAVVPGKLTFPDKPVLPRKPGGFA
jgi:hypothetical protein